MRIQRAKSFLFGLGIILCLGLFGLLAKPVSAAGPNLINFQGKVVNADGTNVTNGSYNFDFVLYDSSTLGTPSDGVHDKWHELTKSVTVTNGVFQTELGSATTLPDFSANPALYLAVRFNADAAGYMSPRVHLDSVPYALNADALGGLSASAFAQLGTGNAGSLSVAYGGVDAFKVLGTGFATVFTVDGASNEVNLGIAGSGTKLNFNGSTANTASIIGGATSSSYTLTLPTALPGSTQCIQSTTGGALSFTSCGGTPAADSLNFTEFADSMTLDATTSLGFGGASNYGLTFTDDGSSNFTVNLSSTGDFVIQDNGTPFVTFSDTGGITLAGTTGINTSGTANTTIGNSAGGTITIGASSGSDLVLNDANWSVTGGGSALFSGAGIGSIVAGTRLNISGSDSTANGLGAGLSITNTASGGNTWSLRTGATGTNTPTGGFSIGDNSQYRVSIDSSGNVGIGDGLLAPAAKLHVAGTALFKNTTGSSTAFQIDNSSGLAIANVNTLTSAWNELANPSFEQNINGWSAKGTPTGSTPLWDNTAANANFGSATLKLSGDAAADGALLNFPFKASTQYSVSFYAKVASGSQSFIIGRQDNGSDGDCAGTITVTTSYQQFTCTWTTGATIGGASNLYIKQSGAGTPTIYVDGISLVESATALAYTAPAQNLQIDSDMNRLILNAGQDPEILPWQASGNNLTTARRAASSVTANGYAYFIGGTTANGSSGAPVTTINYARMNADGTTASWTTSGVSLPVALYGHSSFVANGYLYVIGGCSDSSVTAACTTPVSTVYYSKLNNDGSLGTWQTNVYALGVPATTAQVRGYGAAVFTGGFVYFMGGLTTGPAASAAVYSAKINGDGSISGWVSSGVTALSSARYGQTAVTANGNIYSLGGCTDTAGVCNTAIATVEFAAPTSTGTLGSWTATTSLPTATGFHQSALMNGYVYDFGGRQASTPVASVVYSKLASTSVLGIWSTSANPLPVARQQGAVVAANSYQYILGGFDGTTTLPVSALYTSGARVQIYGGLDLVGLTSQGLSDTGGGGALTAGSIRSVGDLRVDGYADFNNGLSVDSAININAVSATAGQNVFNINNNLANSIFSVRHMGSNFGSLATAGAFIAKNSYFGEEFNVSPVNASQTCLANATETNAGWSRGDIGSHNNAAITCGTSLDQFSGEFNWSTKNGAATAAQGCTVAYQNTVNGVERITAASTATASNAASCTEVLAATRTTSNKIYLAANLPVATYKIKAQTLTAAQNTDRIRVGLSNVNTATAMGAPTDGIFFSNCSTESTTTGSVSGCSNTTWYGHSFSGSAEAATGPVTCSTGSGSLTAQFSYLRIEVRTTNDIHFYADYNAADGINEVECGSGITNTATATALTTWTHVTVATNAARSVVADLDYIRTWQDDNVPLPAEAITETPKGDEIVTTAPITTDSSTTEKTDGLFSFMAATSEDTTFNKDVYVRGTLYADKIKANQIEGLEVFTNQLNSLKDQIAAGTNSTTNSTSSAGLNATSPVNINNIQAINLIALAQIESKGGLVVAKDAQFHGKTFFQLLAEFNGDAHFNSDVNFTKQPTFNNDAGGIAVVKKGARKVQIKFDKAYVQNPIVVASWNTDSDNTEDQDKLFQEGYSFLVTKVDKNGFWLYLNKAATDDVSLNWLASSVKDAKISTSDISQQ